MTELFIQRPGFSLLALITVCYMICILFKQIHKTIRIAARGWPPEHLDANGNFKGDDDDE